MPCRSTWAPTTSTISTNSDGPGRSTYRLTPRFRDRVEDIELLQVRNNQGQMLRLGTVLSVRHTSGPVMVMRYNMYSSSAINGNIAPGTSSGQVIALMHELGASEM